MAKILFIQKAQLLMKENIGIMQLSSVLKKNNHEVDVLLIDANGYPTPEKKISIFALKSSRINEYYKVMIGLHNSKANQSCTEQKIVNYVKDCDPDIIGFSVMTIDSEWVLEIADLLKNHDIKGLIVAGGPHPTFFKDYINNNCIDAINIGEGEYSLLDLANSIDKGTDLTIIKNLYTKKNGRVCRNPLRKLVDINNLPVPDRNLYMKYESFRQQKTYNFVATRGCPYNCTFCFIHQWREEYKDDSNKNKMRLKSIDSVINEIKEFSKQTNIKRVYFSDSTFNLSKKWTINFLKSYGEKVGLPFTINVRPNLLDEDVIKAIADSKCCETVRMGIEVGNEKIRKEILGKSISNKQIYETVLLLKKYNIKIVAFTMYGLPGEKLEEAMETVEMLQNIKPYSYSSQIFHPYIGLDISNSAIENGYIAMEDVLKLGNNEYKQFKSILKQKDIDEVMNVMKLSIIAIEFPFFWPLIKKLVKLKPNRILTLIYVVSTFFLFRRYVI